MDGAADETNKDRSIEPCSHKRKKQAIISSSSSSEPLNSPINNLTDCLLIEILQRLPSAKFVIRCKSVSKRWFALISSPYFIRCFLHHHIIDNDHKYWKKPKPCTLLICYSHRQSNRLFITSENGIFSSGGFKLTYLPCFKPEKRESVCVVASCNDLLLCCTSKEDQSVYYLCNPFTMHWVALPPSPTKNHDIQVGFVCEPYLSYKEKEGYYTINPHFKFHVVRIPKFLGYSILEIFSSETNKWIECEIDVSPLTSEYLCCPFNPNIVACNGLIHWFTIDGKIAAYNPYNIEQIRFIDCPEFIELEGNMYYRCHCLGVCRGFLRILRRTTTRETHETGKFREFYQVLSVWELKDYNTSKWSLEYEVFFHEIISEYSWAKACNHFPAPRAIHPNDGDIVYLAFGNYMISCNMKEQELKVIGESPSGCTASCYAGDVFPIAAPWWPTPVPILSHSAFSVNHYTQV